MKKKILSILLCVCSLCLSMFMLTACNDEDNNENNCNANGDNMPPHVCVYDQEVVANDFKVSDATCTQKAKYYYSCTCGQKGTTTFEYGEVLSHSFTNYVYNNDAKCGVDGTETALCDHNCGEDDTRTKVGSALSHEYGAVEYVWNDRTCTATRICSTDNTHVETETATAVYVKDTDATCDNPETGHYVVTFENEAFEEQRTEIDSVINGCELQHSYATPVYVWVDEICVAKRVCDRDITHVEIETVTATYVKDTDVSCVSAEKGHYVATFVNTAFETQITEPNSVAKGEELGHSFTNYVYNNDAKCGVDGTETALCDHNCGEDDTRTKVGSALSHEYGAVEYVWNDRTCTATRICSTDNTHVETETATAVYVKDTDANFFEPEKGHYVATFKNSNFETQETERESVLLGGVDLNYIIELDKTSILLEVGQSAILTLTFLPVEATRSDVTWTSSNTSVVTVGEGTVKAIQEGTATITASTIDGKTATCTVTVVLNEILFEITEDYSFYKVVGYKGIASVIEIPNIHQGLRVISIEANAFANNQNLTKVIIPDTVEMIGESAFENCKNLDNLVIPGSVESIGKKAFYDCDSLSNIQMLDAVSEAGLVIGESAFENCDLLEEVTMPNSTISIEKLAFANCEKLEKVEIENGASQKALAIKDSAFINCTALKTVLLPNTLTEIGKSAFSNCVSIKAINLPITLQTIGVMAFDGCIELIAITLPNSVTSVGAMCFRNCTKLSTVAFSTSMSKIENTTFQNCVSLIEVILPQNIKHIGNSAFSDCSGLTRLVILGDIETFGNSAFYKCVRLEEIYYNSSIQSNYGSNNYIFYDAGISGDGITVTVGENGQLASGIFKPYGERNIPKVVEIIFEEGVREINSQNYLPYLKKVTLPSTIQVIYPGLFNGCTLLEEVVLPTNDMKDGYTFEYWYTTFNYVGERTENIVLDRADTSTILYARWQANLNTIIFDGNGNTSGATLSMQIRTDASASLTANGFARTGYTFIGWSTTADGEVEYVNGARYLMGTGATYTLYAVWQPNLNILIFDGNGNTDGATLSMQIYTDASASLTANGFVKDGYTFIGWSTTADGEVEYLDGATYLMGVNAEYTLFAVWQEKVNGLYFDGNGNTSGTMSPIELKTDQSALLPAVAFVRAGYTFMGWSTSADGQVEYLDGATYLMGANAEYTLYAVWQANLNTLIFNGNGNTSGATLSMQIRTDASASLTANGFAKNKYIFAGWSTTAAGDVEYLDCATYLMGTNAEYTLYAVWVLNENEITFDGNTNTSGSMSNQTVYNNDNRVLTNNTFVKVGYRFVGWSENANGVVVYDDGAEVVFVQKENYTLYAVWQPNLNTLIFDGNGNTSGETISMQIYTDASASLTVNGFVRAGYTFMGWSTSADGQVEYLDGATYLMGTDATYTLYAVWQPNLNTLIFNGNGNTSGETLSMQIYTDASASLNANGFARTGYTFIGWSTSADGEVEYLDGAPYLMGTNAENTLYAVWQINTYYITYELNSGTNAQENVTSFTILDLPLTLANPRRQSCIFSGWFTEDNGQGLSVTKITELESITIYAYWVGGSEGLIYSLSNNKYTVTGYAGTDTAVVIPSVYSGYPVTSIGQSAFRNCTSLTSIEIPDSVTSIGSYAFYGCSSLVEITLPFVGASKTASNGYDQVFGYIFGYTTKSSSSSISGATYQYSSSSTCYHYYIPTSLKKVTITGGNIPYHAFYNCTSLTSVVIGDSVTSIGEDAFYKCTSLTSVVIGDSVTSIGSYAFYDCTKLTSVVIGDSVTSIGGGAFYNCDSLTSIEIPDSVTNIGDMAFYSCTSLTSVVIGDSVTSIGDDAFYYCTSLTSVVIGDSVTSIGAWAFEGCKSLTKVNYTGTIDKWAQIDFDNHSAHPLYYGKNLYINDELVTEVVLTTATKISDSAFRNCTSLTSIEIPDSVTSIGGGAFEDCTSLTKVNYTGTIDQWAQVNFGSSSANPLYYAKKLYINDELVTDVVLTTATKISDYAFYKCTSLTSIEIPGSVTSIGSYAFRYCTSLTSVVIGDSVTSIGSSAFEYCYSLTSIEIPDSVTIIGSSAFEYCTSLQFTEYGNCKYLGNENNPYLALIDVVSTDYSSYTIHQDTKVIAGYAFYKCTSLTSIEIPDSVTSIGDRAFVNCTSLRSIEIPGSVTSIGRYAFDECTSLTKVNYTGTIDQWAQIDFDNYSANPLYYAKKLYINDELVTEVVLTKATKISDYAFYNCEFLTSIEIPGSVTSIGWYAFDECTSLTSIEIPDSVTSIGDYAFSGCDSLTSITFSDTTTWYRTTNEDDWNNKTGGTSTDVTNSSTNATYFTSTYDDYYWYKK